MLVGVAVTIIQVLSSL